MADNALGNWVQASRLLVGWVGVGRSEGKAFVGRFFLQRENVSENSVLGSPSVSSIRSSCEQKKSRSSGGTARFELLIVVGSGDALVEGLAMETLAFVDRSLNVTAQLGIDFPHSSSPRESAKSMSLANAPGLT